MPTLQATGEVEKQLLLDLQINHRKLKLAAYFQTREDMERLLFMPKSDWTPPLRVLPKQTGEIISTDNEAYTKLLWNRGEKNRLTKEEVKANSKKQTYN